MREISLKSPFWTKWKISKTGWPYPEGYGTFRKNWLTGQVVHLDSGLSLEEAKQAIKELNQ